MISHRNNWNKISIYVQAQPPPAALPNLQKSATRFCLRIPCPCIDLDMKLKAGRGFEHFERLVKEDVEKLKGEVDPPRILIPAAI